MKILHTLVVTLLLAFGASAILTSCTIDTDWHHDNADHSGLYR